MIKLLKSGFWFRLQNSWIVFQQCPFSRTTWGWTVLINYLFRNVIVELEDYDGQ